MSDQDRLQLHATRALAALHMARVLVSRIAAGDDAAGLLPTIHAHLANVRRLLGADQASEAMTAADLAALDRALGYREYEPSRRTFDEQMAHWDDIVRRADRLTGTTLDRVRAARHGDLAVTELSTDEKVIFDDLVMIEHWRESRASSDALAAELLKTPGNVGYDDAGNLVETVGDGKRYRIIKPADHPDP